MMYTEIWHQFACEIYVKLTSTRELIFNPRSRQKCFYLQFAVQCQVDILVWWQSEFSGCVPAPSHFQVKIQISPLPCIRLHVSLLNHLSLAWPYTVMKTPDKPVNTRRVCTHTVLIKHGCSVNVDILRFSMFRWNATFCLHQRKLIIRWNHYIEWLCSCKCLSSLHRIYICCICSHEDHHNAKQM